MSDGFRTLAQLREVVRGMERDLGLDVLLPVERDVLYAVGVLTEGGKLEVRTEELAAHGLLASVPPSTLHRALRKLIGAGFVAHPEGRKAGMFVLVKGR